MALTALIYSGGLGMVAILVIIGTRYACYVDNRGDQTCLPYQFCFGMPSFLKGTRHACHIFKI